MKKYLEEEIKMSWQHVLTVTLMWIIGGGILLLIWSAVHEATIWFLSRLYRDMVREARKDARRAEKRKREKMMQEGKPLRLVK